jgi:hypothetical protein
VRSSIQLWSLFVIMSERVWRRRYAEERAYAEWFDLGGES